MMRLTRPISDEADYHSILGDVICSILVLNVLYASADNELGNLFVISIFILLLETSFMSWNIS